MEFLCHFVESKTNTPTVIQTKKILVNTNLRHNFLAELANEFFAVFEATTESNSFHPLQKRASELLMRLFRSGERPTVKTRTSRRGRSSPKPIPTLAVDLLWDTLASNQSQRFQIPIFQVHYKGDSAVPEESDQNIGSQIENVEWKILTDRQDFLQYRHSDDQAIPTLCVQLKMIDFQDIMIPETNDGIESFSLGPTLSNIRCSQYKFAESADQSRYFRSTHFRQFGGTGQQYFWNITCNIAFVEYLGISFQSQSSVVSRAVKWGWYTHSAPSCITIESDLMNGRAICFDDLEMEVPMKWLGKQKVRGNKMFRDGDCLGISVRATGSEENGLNEWELILWRNMRKMGRVRVDLADEAFSTMLWMTANQLIDACLVVGTLGGCREVALKMDVL